MSSTRRPNPRGNLIFKDVTSDGDDCDSHVDEGEQDEEGKDASGEAHERDKRQRRSRGVKLLPKGDGDVGVPWDAHVRLEAPRARRILSVLPEARGSRGGVHVYPHLRAELLQLERVVSGYVAVRGVGARVAWAGRLGATSCMCSRKNSSPMSSTPP